MLTAGLDQEAYERTGGEFSVYGVQYQPGFDDAVSSRIGWRRLIDRLMRFALLVHCLDR